MNNYYISFLFILGLLFSLNNQIISQSQNYSCGQHIVLKKLLEDSVFKSLYEKEQKSLVNKSQNLNLNNRGIVYKIPVVFHIIHNNGVEKIDRDQAIDALQILNRDLRALRADTATVDTLFKPLIADIEVEFVLATKSPDGSCFNGITMTESVYSYNNGGINGSDQVNDIMMYNNVYQGNWPGNQYLNVFVCGSVGTGIAGYTNYPSGFFGNTMNNGVWLRHDYCGSIGTGSPSGSKTFVHEIGHWLNLPHTWGSTNEPGLATNCNSDDGVSDTPNTIGSNWCNYNEVTCGPVANIENHMEYSSCRKMFTQGQKSRMRTALNSTTGGRSNLITPSNHFATGIDAPAPFCEVDFFANRYVTCSGDSIYFEDYSFHNPISWDWNFQGASPNTSNLESTYAKYQLPGLYDVSLTASGDSINFITETKNESVVVMNYFGDQLPYYQGFENVNFNAPEWISNDLNWSITDEVSYNGSYCLKLQNQGLAEGTKQTLESKTLNLSDSSKAYFTFKYAYARKNSSNNDFLRILGSYDCGKTWATRKIIYTNQLITAADQNNFIPTYSEWKEANIVSLIGPFCVSNFRFKFEFNSGGGNNLYIDNINISYENTTGTDSFINQEISVYPNPSSDFLKISAFKNIDEINIYDIMGKQVYSNKTNTKTLDLNILNFKNGYYSIKIKVGEFIKVKSFIKN
jgi:hypothetical protein